MSTNKHNILKIAVTLQLIVIFGTRTATAQLDPNFQSRIEDRTFPMTVPAPELHSDPKQQGAHRIIKPGHSVKPASKPKKRS